MGQAQASAVAASVTPPLPGRQGLPGHQQEEASAPFPSGEIQRLQEQNASLRSAVAQMRAEMEALSEQVQPPARPAGDTAGVGSPADAAPGERGRPDACPGP